MYIFGTSVLKKLQSHFGFTPEKVVAAEDTATGKTY
jgi:hypothetical protein